MERDLSPGRSRVTLWVLAVLVGGALLAFVFWDWLNTPTSAGTSSQSNADTIRIIALILGGAIAIMLALWRSSIAQRQANAAQRQSQTVQLGLLNERYQKGAEMLGSKVLSVRLGGIYALRRLAEEHPQEYHLQIMGLLCAFVRHPTEPESQIGNELRLDVEAAMEAIALRGKSGIELERRVEFSINLRKAKLRWLSWERLEDVDHYGTNVCLADLSCAQLPQHANLSRMDGRGVKLLDSILVGVNFYKSDFIAADLTNALLKNANLSCAILENTNLTGADLRGARGLTQAQLDKACADRDKPPNLENLLDEITGEPLIWRGRQPLSILKNLERPSSI